MTTRSCSWCHQPIPAGARSDVKAAVLALLPLATDEPADLIEWAAALGAGS